MQGSSTNDGGGIAAQTLALCNALEAARRASELPEEGAKGLPGPSREEDEASTSAGGSDGDEGPPGLQSRGHSSSSISEVGSWPSSAPTSPMARPKAASFCAPELLAAAPWRKNSAPGPPAPKPPGLAAAPIGPPPGLDLPVAPPPGLTKNHEVPSFNRAAFRREVVATLHELSSRRNVAAAVRNVRAHNVPKDQQAAEFADLLTRCAEEGRGNARRLYFAFTCALAAGGVGSAFDRRQCLLGLEDFFRDVYGGLLEEVPRLPAIARAELVPVLREVFPEGRELDRTLPLALRA